MKLKILEMYLSCGWTSVCLDISALAHLPHCFGLGVRQQHRQKHVHLVVTEKQGTQDRKGQEVNSPRQEEVRSTQLFKGLLDQQFSSQ